MSNYCIIYATFPDEKTAQTIAENLVESELVACVNISSSVKSIYKWEGKVQKDTEFSFFAKTISANYERVEGRIKELHPYDCPAILRLSLDDGNKEFLSWINSSVKE